MIGRGMMLTDFVNCRRAEFLQSATGGEIEKELYSETMAEMRDYTNVPSRLPASA